MTKPIKRRKFRKSCEQYMRERMQDNRSREVEQLFNQFERDAIREQLSKDAPTRAKENGDIRI